MKSFSPRILWCITVDLHFSLPPTLLLVPFSEMIGISSIMNDSLVVRVAGLNCLFQVRRSLVTAFLQENGVSSMTNLIGITLGMCWYCFSKDELSRSALRPSFNVTWSV